AAWEAAVGGATFRALNLEPLAETKVPLPPPVEHRRIALFLDQRVPDLDRLLELRERHTRLVQERRIANVFSLVTGGGIKKRRPSGLTWVADLPAAWPTVKLTYVARLGSGHTPSRGHPEWWTNCHIPWITTGEVQQVRDDRRE